MFARVQPRGRPGLPRRCAGVWRPERRCSRSAPAVPSGLLCRFRSRPRLPSNRGDMPSSRAPGALKKTCSKRLMNFRQRGVHLLSELGARSQIDDELRDFSLRIDNEMVDRNEVVAAGLLVLVLELHQAVVAFLDIARGL